MITIYGPDRVRDAIRPNGPGLSRIAWGGWGRDLTAYAQPACLQPTDVARVVDWMQELVPLGSIGDLDILCLDMQIMSAADVTAQHIDGEYRDGTILLSGKISEDARQLLTHELTHALSRHLITRMEEEAFFALVNQVRGNEQDPEWEARPQERMAEYISCAIWGQPIVEGMPPLDPATLARVREWALFQFQGYPRAEVVIDGQQPEGIILTIGSTTYTVNGEPRTMDVAPFIQDNRTVVPVRFIAEALGKTVEWDEENQQVHIK